MNQNKKQNQSQKVVFEEKITSKKVSSSVVQKFQKLHLRVSTLPPETDGTVKPIANTEQAAHQIRKAANWTHRNNTAKQNQVKLTWRWRPQSRPPRE